MYPYASQGIMCQGSDFGIATVTGGVPVCMDVYGRMEHDGAPVHHLPWKHAVTLVTILMLVLLHGMRRIQSPPHAA
jgi:hypothetical protein